MAHVSLDDTQVDAGFEEMSGPACGGINSGVAVGVNGDSFFSDSGSNLGPAEGTLDTPLGHGRWSVLCSITVSTKGGEEEARMTVGDPIAAEQMEGGLRERHVAILGALPTVDMDHPRRAGSSTCGWNRYRRLRGGDLHGVSGRRNRRWKDRRNSGRF